jgi:hypothetical protein
MVLKNLKRILPNLLEWSKEDGESYAELDELYALTDSLEDIWATLLKNVGEFMIHLKRMT